MRRFLSGFLHLELVACGLSVCAPGGTVAAQWLSVPIPGTPSTADGTPNRKAAGNLLRSWKRDSMKVVLTNTGQKLFAGSPVAPRRNDEGQQPTREGEIR